MDTRALPSPAVNTLLPFFIRRVGFVLVQTAVSFGLYAAIAWCWSLSKEQLVPSAILYLTLYTFFELEKWYWRVQFRRETEARMALLKTETTRLHEERDQQ